MPLVNIFILKGKSPDYVKAVADSINSAVIETMGFPLDDRYQVIQQLDPECLQLQERPGDRVIMHLVMRAGRSNKSKQAFYRKSLRTSRLTPAFRRKTCSSPSRKTTMLTGHSPMGRRRSSFDGPTSQTPTLPPSPYHVQKLR